MNVVFPSPDSPATCDKSASVLSLRTLTIITDHDSECSSALGNDLVSDSWCSALTLEMFVS